MWVMAGVGGLLAGLALVTIVGVALAMVSGTDVNEYKPVGLLSWEGRRGSEAISAGAAKELLARLQDGRLSESQVRTAVRTALAVQADESRAWSEAWGDIVETAKTKGHVSEEEYQEFRNHAAVLEVETRSRVALGDPVPVVVRLKEVRMGSGSEAQAAVWLEEASVGGRAAERAACSGATWSMKGWRCGRGEGRVRRREHRGHRGRSAGISNWRFEISDGEGGNRRSAQVQSAGSSGPVALYNQGQRRGRQR
jgi:hypothetical protein